MYIITYNACLSMNQLLIIKKIESKCTGDDSFNKVLGSSTRAGHCNSLVAIGTKNQALATR